MNAPKSLSDPLVLPIAHTPQTDASLCNGCRGRTVATWWLTHNAKGVSGFFCDDCLRRIRRAPDGDPWLVTLQVAAKLGGGVIPARPGGSSPTNPRR